MKIPSFVWIGLVLILGFGFLMVLANNKNNQTVANATLPVEVDVYIDFNCPHCADFEPTVKAAREKYGDNVDIKIKNMPFLTSGQNPDSSVLYSYAYIAARNQGKGNEYAEALFKWITYSKNPSNTTFTYSAEEKSLFLSVVNPTSLAEFLKLDMTLFNTDKDSAETKSVMKAEKDSAVKIMGAPSTPAIFFYGNLYKLNTFDEFDAKIDSYIKAAQANQE